MGRSYYNQHMEEASIDPKIQILLQYSGEEVLVRTIWALTPEQKRSHLFKQLGEQRYLSALRSGGIDNAEMTKLAFKMDPYFLVSRFVLEAAKSGYRMQVMLNHPEVAERIKVAFNLPEDTPVV